MSGYPRLPIQDRYPIPPEQPLCSSQTRPEQHSGKLAGKERETFGGKYRGSLHMPVTMAQSSVAPKLARFLARYPELRLDIALKGGQIDPIAQRFDVVFQTMRPEVDSQLIQKRMITVGLGIFGSPDYLSSTSSS